MKIRYLIVFICIICLSFQKAGSGLEFFEGSFNKAAKTAKRQDKLLFVFIGEATCDICQHTRESFRDPKVADLYDKNFISYHIDPGTMANNIRVSNWGVTEVPTFLYMDSKKNIIFRTKGYQTPQALLENANKALSYPKDGKKKE
jgi:thioredoxin-related protein